MTEMIKSFLSGGFGGACLVVVGHPLDTVKVKLMADQKGEYKGMADCFRKTIARNGITGLYAGMSAPIIAVTPIFATYFWGFDLGKTIAAKVEGVPSNQISTWGVIFAGGFSAIPGTMVMVPGDLIKVKLQLEKETGKAPRFTNPINTAQYILKTEGPTGLFRGTALTLLRDVPGSVAYYTTYEVLKKYLTNLSKPKDGSPAKLSPLAIITAGGMSGIANWLVAVPPDVLKSRFQANPQNYPGGLRQVFSELMRNEGPGAMFKGLAPALTRAFPANAACFLGMEVSKKFLDTIM